MTEEHSFLSFSILRCKRKNNSLLREMGKWRGGGTTNSRHSFQVKELTDGIFEIFLGC